MRALLCAGSSASGNLTFPFDISHLSIAAACQSDSFHLLNSTAGFLFFLLSALHSELVKELYTRLESPVLIAAHCRIGAHGHYVLEQRVDAHSLDHLLVPVEGLEFEEFALGAPKDGSAVH